MVMGAPTLLPPQREVLQAGLLESGFSCILQMPTGSGKTWLAEQAMAKVLQQGRRVIYLAPLRALASELAARWQTAFTESVGVFTGDTGMSSRSYPVPFEKAHLLVMTPERLDICTRTWRRHWDWIPEVDLIVVDEFHLLGEKHRGARLEGALSRFQRLNPFVRLLCLSATLGNREELADWLGAVEYVTDWRPVPLHWRIVRFRHAEDKPQLLEGEVKRCLQAGGQSLVFVQSRRRAEWLSRLLQERGLPAVHHHAGLDHQRRQQVEDDFRQHRVEVLVATATLEMGLNLPVRQVILYDLQQFDGNNFIPLSTNTVWQRVGRAGRPGLDDTAEAVLLAPRWDNQSQSYATGHFEPIRSMLQEERALAEQLMVEVEAGYARTEAQLSRIISRSLAVWQGSLHESRVNRLIDLLQDNGLLQQVPNAEENKTAGLRFQVSPLGRIAVRHLLFPATVLYFQRVCRIPELTFLDLLLLVASVPDCEPVLTVDFEELDDLAQRLRAEPSRLLALSCDTLYEPLGITGQRLLSALKMALAIRTLTRSDDVQGVAKDFGCYAFELERLRESIERLLLALQDLLKGHSGWSVDTVNILERVSLLQRMVAAQLDVVAITLTQVKGVGPTLARRLVEHGIPHIEALAHAQPDRLAQIPGISRQRADVLIADATLLVALRPVASYQEVVAEYQIHTKTSSAKIDPYRLRRAVELTVHMGEPGHYRVTGGNDPHVVKIVQGIYRCDCADFRKGQPQCKHVLAVKLHQDDAALQSQVKLMKEPTTDAQWNLFQLWADKSSATAVGNYR